MAESKKATDRAAELAAQAAAAAGPIKDKATELAQEAYTSGKGIIEIIREKKLLTEQQITDLLDPIKLTNLDTSLYTK